MLRALTLMFISVSCYNTRMNPQIKALYPDLDLEGLTVQESSNCAWNRYIMREDEPSPPCERIGDHVLIVADMFKVFLFCQEHFFRVTNALGA